MHAVFCEDKYPPNLFVYPLSRNIKEIGSHKRYSLVNIGQYSVLPAKSDTYVILCLQLLSKH